MRIQPDPDSHVNHLYIPLCTVEGGDSADPGHPEPDRPASEPGAERPETGRHPGIYICIDIYLR